MDLSVHCLITFLLLVSVGAFGGYLSLINNRADKPSELNGRSRADILHALMQGAAGAIIIVTLAPWRGCSGDPGLIVPADRARSPSAHRRTSPASICSSALRSSARSVFAPLAVSRNTFLHPALGEPAHLRIHALTVG
jgi:hypothetical protein